MEPLDNPPAVIGGLWMAEHEHPHHDPVYCGTHVTEARITDDPFQIRPQALSRLISGTGLMSTAGQ